MLSTADPFTKARVSSNFESCFPALDIIRRAGPPEAKRYEIVAAIWTHLGNHIWPVRELAARSISNLMLQDDWLSSFTGHIISPSINNSNRVHGLLLTARLALERRQGLGLLIGM